MFLAPPCGTASRARSIKLKRKSNAPEPLRDDNNPNGLKFLSFVNKMKISQANKLYHLTAQVVKYAVKHGMIVCVENPLFWATTFWVSVAKLLRYTIFHSCQYGSNRQKKTMLAHNHKAFNQLSKLCPGESKKHRHLPWGITPSGHFATSEETAYPVQLARDVAQCFTQALAEAGMKLPPSQLHDMTSSSQAVLQAVRAQSGLQPKHSKLPPLVPEFATIVAVEVSSDTPSSQPPHSQIPQHSKFLSSAPLVTAPVKGGVMSAVPLRIPPMTGLFRSGGYTTPRMSSSGKQHRQDIHCP